MTLYSGQRPADIGRHHFLDRFRWDIELPETRQGSARPTLSALSRSTWRFAAIKAEVVTNQRNHLGGGENQEDWLIERRRNRHGLNEIFKSNPSNHPNN